ncbi:MAG: hypothetical protein H7Z72_10220 [Bacteroidetes bacterium]|nr:hypothetical protein [Fibrella sp.]
MKTKLMQLILICSTLVVTVLTYSAIVRLSEGTFPMLTRVMLVGVVAVYAYGAVLFMAMKGIDLFTKAE